MLRTRYKTSIVAEAFAKSGELFGAFFEMLRPQQWVKNTLLFIPLLAAHHWEVPSLLRVVPAVLAFIILSSTSYILNDLLDLASDRKHPRKCKRPLASGRLSSRLGIFAAVGLGVVGLLAARQINLDFFALAGLYLALAGSYSLFLKRLLIVDVVVLVILYDLRILAGAEAADVTVSAWLLASVSCLFLSLASIKRLKELADARLRGIDQIPGRGYNTHDYQVVRKIGFASGILSATVVCLYAESYAAAVLYESPKILWGAGVTLAFWTGHLIKRASRGVMHDDPILFILGDPTSRGCMVLVLGLIAIATF